MTLFERRHYRKIADAIGKSANFEECRKNIERMLAEDNPRFHLRKFRKRIQSTWENTHYNGGK